VGAAIQVSECPLRVISGRDALQSRCLLYPQKRTSISRQNIETTIQRNRRACPISRVIGQTPSYASQGSTTTSTTCANAASAKRLEIKRVSLAAHAIHHRGDAEAAREGFARGGCSHAAPMADIALFGKTAILQQ
jgi:hypothetical protein